MNPKYLTTDAQLQSFAERAATAEWLALDTEFVRENTYYPILCLAQMATADEIVLLDLLTINDLAPLAALLQAGPVKIMHAPGQDLEAFATVDIRGIAPLFDTQQAQALLGGKPQVGYAGLVAERLGVDLAKDQTRTDWSRRPLSDAQQRYAADDVRYLGALYAELSQALAEAGRDEWMREDMRAFEAPFEAPDGQQLGLRSRALERMEGAEPGVFVALSAWRDRRARERNRPRSWIAKDALLASLARYQPRTLAEMEAVPDCPPKLIQRQGEALLDCITQALAKPLEIPPAVDRDRLKRARAVISQHAATLGLDPGVLASRADLEQWLRAEQGRIATPWRRQLLAADLADCAA